MALKTAPSMKTKDKASVVSLSIDNDRFSTKSSKVLFTYLLPTTSSSSSVHRPITAYCVLPPWGAPPRGNPLFGCRLQGLYRLSCLVYCARVPVDRWPKTL